MRLRTGGKSPHTELRQVGAALCDATVLVIRDQIEWAWRSTLVSAFACAFCARLGDRHPAPNNMNGTHMTTLLKSILVAAPMVLSAFAAQASGAPASGQQAVRIDAAQAERLPYTTLTAKMRPDEIPEAVRQRGSLASAAIIQRPINQLGITRW